MAERSPHKRGKYLVAALVVIGLLLAVFALIFRQDVPGAAPRPVTTSPTP